MTTQETNLETTTTENAAPEAPAVIYYGKDFAAIQAKTNASTAAVLQETLKQFAHKITTIKQEDNIKIEGTTIEELQAALAKMMMEKPTASMKAEDINLAAASMQDLLKHKTDMLGGFLFDLLLEVTEQLKPGAKTKGTRQPSGKPRKQVDLELYALQIEGINGNKPFLAMNVGAFTLDMKTLTDKITAASLADKYQKEILAGPKKGQMGWNKEAILKDFGKKVEIASADIYAKFDGKASNITVEALGEAMPKLTTKKVEAKK
ncbi:hypothetical protein [Pseudomonas putida]|uniref:Uncharacterized protein n=1 Tax=Pseudomonas putida TaxID=303 RepID=A0AAD0L4H1_PSEPU|nr:hypothetical protein [Pseudomonas putida]AXA24256.1 hypothetical protein C1S65_09085 [Pseudomonas putida]